MKKVSLGFFILIILAMAFQVFAKDDEAKPQKDSQKKPVQLLRTYHMDF